MNSALWAKLITPIMPKTSVKPVATSTRLTPTVSPITSWVRIASSDMRSELAGPAVGVRDVLENLDHRVVQRVGLHDPHVEVLDRVVVLGIEAQAAARAVDLHGLDDLDQPLLVGHVAARLPQRAEERLRHVVARSEECRVGKEGGSW